MPALYRLLSRDPAAATYILLDLLMKQRHSCLCLTPCSSAPPIISPIHRYPSTVSAPKYLLSYLPAYLPTIPCPVASPPWPFSRPCSLLCRSSLLYRLHAARVAVAPLHLPSLGWWVGSSWVRYLITVSREADRCCPRFGKFVLWSSHRCIAVACSVSGVVSG